MDVRVDAPAGDVAPAGWGFAAAFALVAVAGAAALVTLPVLVLAPNRIAPGQPVGAIALGAWPYAVAAGLLAVGGALGLCARHPRSRLVPSAAFALAFLAFAGLLLGVGAGAHALLAGRPPAARVLLASGAWVAGASALLLALEAARRGRLAGAASVAICMFVGLGLVLAWTGTFDALSLAVEARARQDALRQAFWQHLGLAAAALGLALALAVPAGLLQLRRGRVAAAVDALAGGVQVVPALALLGALVAGLSSLLAWMPALRGLGLAAIGPTPAIIGTAAYLVLPLMRSVAAGLEAAEPAALDAARALGLGRARTLVRVRLPLGAPILLGGLRVAVVQGIGFSTLGGLVGAGGFGAIVFEGMSQFAADLILLGAAPVIGLALVADRLLRLAAARAEAAS